MLLVGFLKWLKALPDKECRVVGFQKGVAEMNKGIRHLELNHIK